MFAEKARQATLDAAKIADLEVIELINEPTAAVLHYASLPGVEVGGRVMIFDLGGGTFDVTFAEVKNKKVDVMTSRGDKYLGGRDFDKDQFYDVFGQGSTFPQVLKDQEKLGGCMDTVKYLRENKLV